MTTRMNCKDFKISIDAAPAEAFDGRDSHLAECAECAQYLAAARQFEGLLGKAMKVPVPDMEQRDMPLDTQSEANNIIDFNAARVGAPAASRFSAPIWLGLAASLALGAFIAYRFVDIAPPATDSNLLASQLLDHLSHEPYALKRTSQPVSFELLHNVVDPVDAEVNDQIGLISYASTCTINGESIPHLVVQGEQGPVTILIMPNEHVDAVVPVENAEFHGAIVPAGDGSIAIIGRKGESIDDIRSKIGQSIRLSI